LRFRITGREHASHGEQTALGQRPTGTPGLAWEDRKGTQWAKPNSKHKQLWGLNGPFLEKKYEDEDSEKPLNRKLGSIIHHSVARGNPVIYDWGKRTNEVKHIISAYLWVYSQLAKYKRGEFFLETNSASTKKKAN